MIWSEEFIKQRVKLHQEITKKLKNCKIKPNVRKAIEKILVPVLSEYGFNYTVGENGLWTFSRNPEGHNQTILIFRGFANYVLHYRFSTGKEPFFQSDLTVLDKSINSEWLFYDQQSLEGLIFQMAMKAEEILVPFLDNEIYNPEVNAPIYFSIEQEAKLTMMKLEKLNTLTNNKPDKI